MAPSAVLHELSLARLVANYAESLGARNSQCTTRVASTHLGAVLADAILQAGVSYRTVVHMRVNRIQSLFPEAATLPGLMTLLERHGPAEFLLWTHPVKTSRFVSLTRLLAAHNITTTVELKGWLNRGDTRDNLLKLHGIGPKTYDYLCCLVGIDCIAVDRHVRRFASEAGVVITDYKTMKVVVSYAADLLGVTRRDFDAWIWQTISKRNGRQRQLSLM